MGEVIKVDAGKLQHAAQVLKADANSMESFLLQVYNALKPHDPSNGGGDEVGEAIGRQYFENATSLLHSAGIAVLLLKDIADFADNGARGASEIEQLLAKINRDLSVGDAKLPPPISSTPPEESTGSNLSPRR